MIIKRYVTYKTVLRLGVISMFTCAFLCRCANPLAPQGGPRDSLPPKIVKATPEFRATNFKGSRILIEFDEYVQLKDQQKEMFTSPFMGKKPNVTLRGRGIQIDLKEPLDSNRTYSINFGRSVVDNNEANPLTGLRYVFSTGDNIDSMIISGQTIDAYTKDTVGNVYMLLYDAKTDSIPKYDSVVLKNQALSVARSYPNGIFIAENLQRIPYRVYAMEDKNGNLRYDPGVDRIGFIDGTIDPAEMESFDMWYDSTRMYMQADPQILMRMFTENPPKRHVYTGSKREAINKVNMHFSAPNPQIDTLIFDGIDSSMIVKEYLNPKKDSITFWFKDLPEKLPDTIKGHMVYQKHDSTGVMGPSRQELKLEWKRVEPKEKKRGAVDKDSVNPFTFNGGPAADVNPETNFKYTFAYPLSKIDSAVWRLEKELKDSTWSRTKFTLKQDSLHIREWTISAPWEVGSKYRITIPKGAIQNINHEFNDSIQKSFTIISPDKFASLVLNIQGKTPESQYIVEIMNSAGKVAREYSHLKTGRHTINYVTPGVTKIKIIEDLNRNGKWDTGSLTERRQAERVEIFVDDSGSEEITTKVNWELIFDLHMEDIFGPITMSKLKENIARNETVRLKALAERRAAKAKEKKKGGETGSGTQGGGMGIGSALGGATSGGIGGMTNMGGGGR